MGGRGIRMWSIVCICVCQQGAALLGCGCCGCCAYLSAGRASEHLSSTGERIVSSLTNFSPQECFTGGQEKTACGNNWATFGNVPCIDFSLRYCAEPPPGYAAPRDAQHCTRWATKSTLIRGEESWVRHSSSMRS